MVASVARHPKTARLRWRRLRRGRYELHTPYGTLHVDAYFHGCWTAARDTALLVHANNNEVAVIIGLPEAKATALLHAAVGFGNRAPLDDGLIWRLGLAMRMPPMPVDPSVPLPDNYEWEEEQLDGVLEEFLGQRVVADESLRSDLARRAAKWQLPPPKWSYCDGAYELRTPFWLMRLECFFGWYVTRDTVPLVWMHNQKPVFFHKLEDAQTCALLYAGGRDSNYSPGGTCWKKSIQFVIAVEATSAN